MGLSFVGLAAAFLETTNAKLSKEKDSLKKSTPVNPKVQPKEKMASRATDPSCTSLAESEPGTAQGPSGFVPCTAKIGTDIYTTRPPAYIFISSVGPRCHAPCDRKDARSPDGRRHGDL